MKTKRFFLIAAFIFTVSGLQAQNYAADPGNSNIIWRGEKVTGKHWGNINLKSGEFTVENDKITAGTFVIDMTSIVNKDIESAEYNQKLVGHLKSDDFFGVETYPEAKLVITKSTAFKNNKADVRGDITIKGKTESILFPVERNGNNYSAKITVDRSKFDVKYGSKSFFEGLGDKVIYDDFILEVELVVEKK